MCPWSWPRGGMTRRGSPKNWIRNATRSSAFTTRGKTSKSETNHAQLPEKNTRNSIMTPVTYYRNHGWSTYTILSEGLKEKFNRSFWCYIKSAYRSIQNRPPWRSEAWFTLTPSSRFPTLLARSGLCSPSRMKHQWIPTYMVPASQPYHMWPSVSWVSRSSWKESTGARHLVLTRYPAACYKNCMKNSLLSSQPSLGTHTSLVVFQKSGSQRGSPQSLRRGPSVMQQIIDLWALLASLPTQVS